MCVYGIQRGRVREPCFISFTSKGFLGFIGLFCAGACFLVNQNVSALFRRMERKTPTGLGTRRPPLHLRTNFDHSASQALQQYRQRTAFRFSFTL